MQDKVKNGEWGRNKWNPAAIAIISAILGSGSGVALVFNTPLGQQIARPDPFTGTQAATLVTEIGHIRNSLDGHLSNHPDTANQFNARIATLEAQYAIILANQDRILDRLNQR